MTMKILRRQEAPNGISYYRAGAGSPVVLIHGVGLRAESFCPQIAFLKNAYNVYAIDMPGHGDSRKLDSANPDLGDFTATLEGFVDEVIGEPILLAGHSMGAMIALDFARGNPVQCLGVAALNAVHRRSPETSLAVRQRALALKMDDSHDVASAPVKRWFGEIPIGFEREMAGYCRDWLTQTDRGGYAAAYRIFAHNDGLSDGEFARLNLPILFLTGAQDKNSTVEMSQAMAALAPDGEAVVISGARHLAQLTHAQQVNCALGVFFQRCQSPLSYQTMAGASTGVN